MTVSVDGTQVIVTTHKNTTLVSAEEILRVAIAVNATTGEVLADHKGNTYAPQSLVDVHRVVSFYTLDVGKADAV